MIYSMSLLFLMSMIWIVVETDDDVFPATMQYTTVPFKPMPTESMDSVEFRGIVVRAEVLIKVNEEPFTTTGCDC